MAAAAASPRLYVDPTALTADAASSFRQPQWADPDKETLAQDPSLKSFACSTCKRPKEDCLCLTCVVCLASVGRFTRHHCRRCWRPVCSKCRDRQRVLNPFAPLSERTRQPVCDPCAVYRALPRTTDDSDFMGLALLRSAMQFPRQCVNTEECGTLCYAPMCTSCSLPTVPAWPHEERLVRVVYCCSWANRCTKCASADQRMADFEKRNDIARMKSFAALTSDDVDRCFSHVIQPLPNLSMGATRDVLMALVCSSICYEYAAYPHTTLALSDVPCASLLRLKECKQLYSFVEGPDRTMFVAFPGTHDLRTIVTDVQFHRVREFEYGMLNGGLLGGSGTPRCDDGSIPKLAQRVLHGGRQLLWGYKIHAGFYFENKKLKTAVPTGILQAFVLQGYRLVICGHSLGGALAMLTTLRLLTEDLSAFLGNVQCITFGSPLVGDTNLSQRIERSGFKELFTHLVYRTDIVPRLLTERQAHIYAYESLKDTVAAKTKTVNEWATASANRLRNVTDAVKPSNISRFVSTVGQRVASRFSKTAPSPSGTTTPPPAASRASDPPAGPAEPEAPSQPSGDGDGEDEDEDEDEEENVDHPAVPLDVPTTTVCRDAGTTMPPAATHNGRKSFDAAGRYFFIGRPLAASQAAGLTPSAVLEGTQVLSNVERFDDRAGAFATLKMGVPGAKVTIGDHLLSSYNRGLTMVTTGGRHRRLE